MPRRALRCVVDLSIHAVSAPGVWLPSKEDVYLSVSMFGQYRNTRLLTSVFPLLIHEKFRFEKTYYTALDPSEVTDYLDDELVVFELVQLSEYTDGAIRLASYSTNARDFLYPYPSLAPCYSSTDREILLSRTVAFPGISPKLEFATKTVIRESISPEVDALEDALEAERERRTYRKTRRSPTRRARLWSSSSSEEDYSSLGGLGGVEPSPHYTRPTVASVSRSRSPSLPRKIADIDLSDTIDPRPPFVVRKLSSDLIGRQPGGGPDSHAKTKPKKLRRIGYSSDDLDLSRSSSKQRYYLEKVIREPLKDPLPVYRSKFDDDLDAEVADLTSRKASYYTPRPRPRSASPLRYKPSFEARYGGRSYSPPPRTYTSLVSETELERSRRLLRLARLYPSYYWPYWYYDPLYYPRYYRYYDPLLDLEVATNLAKSRSPQSLVHVDRGHYWTEKAAALSGKSHRELFNSNLSKAYNRLHRNARWHDTTKF